MAHFFPLQPLDAESDEASPLRWLGVIGLPQSPLVVSHIPAESELHAELSALKSDLRKRYSLAQVVASDSAMQRIMARLQLAIAANTWPWGCRTRASPPSATGSRRGCRCNCSAPPRSSPPCSCWCR